MTAIFTPRRVRGLYDVGSLLGMILCWGSCGNGQRNVMPRFISTTASCIGDVPLHRLAEGWQLHQIVFRHYLDRLSCLAPGGQPPDDHERVESFFPQEVRHPGARGLAGSST